MFDEWLDRFSERLGPIKNYGLSMAHADHSSGHSRPLSPNGTPHVEDESKKGRNWEVKVDSTYDEKRTVYKKRRKRRDERSSTHSSRSARSSMSIPHGAKTF
eukprot:UN33812